MGTPFCCAETEEPIGVSCVSGFCVLQNSASRILYLAWNSKGEVPKREFPLNMLVLGFHANLYGSSLQGLPRFFSSSFFRSPSWSHAGGWINWMRVLRMVQACELLANTLKHGGLSCSVAPIIFLFFWLPQKRSSPKRVPCFARVTEQLRA